METITNETVSLFIDHVTDKIKDYSAYGALLFHEIDPEITDLDLSEISLRSPEKSGKIEELNKVDLYIVELSRICNIVKMASSKYNIVKIGISEDVESVIDEWMTYGKLQVLYNKLNSETLSIIFNKDNLH